MLNHAEIVKRAGTAAEVAERHGVSIFAVRSWIRRDSIPPDQWLAFANAGFATLEELAAARRAA